MITPEAIKAIDDIINRSKNVLESKDWEETNEMWKSFMSCTNDEEREILLQKVNIMVERDLDRLSEYLNEGKQ